MATNPPSQHAGTVRRDNVAINVTAVLYNGINEDFNTVENVQNILGIHEYFGHGVMGYGANTRQEHSKAYNLQKQHRTYPYLTQADLDLIEGND